MKTENKLFYRDILAALKSNSLAIFAGAGLSKASGFVNWKELLKDITEDLQLDYSKEEDLISIAQYNYNKVGGKSMLNDAIIDKFNKDAEISENHKILARLPIQTYWTTNYDNLIERSIGDAKRIPDVKHSISQLRNSNSRRDAIVYKMHGDSTLPEEAVITKDDYERYHLDHRPFISALEADLQSKLFLFIGFSFSDPNLDYILSRVRVYMKGKTKHHYHFVKRVKENDYGIKDKADYEYKLRKQNLFVEDLKRFGLQPIYLESYSEISELLSNIENQFSRRSIFISGSAEEYGRFSRDEAQTFIHKLSKQIIKSEYRIINGFGWGIGSAVINGALEAVYEKPLLYSETQLVLRPFPQYESGDKKKEDLMHEYRHRMIRFAGIVIFLFGNKIENNSINDNAGGLHKEFQIAIEYGLIPIPVATTGYASKKIYDIVMANPAKYFPQHQWIPEALKYLAEEGRTTDELIATIIEILARINK